jgi:ABC-type multidrug transport system fused ATPase/permease subunit
MALTTIAGIAAVMPFFAVLGDPGLIERNAALHWLQVRFEISGHPQFTLLLGCGFIVLLLVSSVVNLAGSVAMSRFAWRVGDRLRVRLFTQYLGRDYLFHARQSGAVLTSRVLYQSDRVIGLLQSGFVFVSNLLMIVLIVASIALVDAGVAIAGLLLFGVSYALVCRGTPPAAGQRPGADAGRCGTGRRGGAGAGRHQGSAGIAGTGALARRFAAASASISQAASNTQLIDSRRATCSSAWPA